MAAWLQPLVDTVPVALTALATICAPAVKCASMPSNQLLLNRLLRTVGPALVWSCTRLMPALPLTDDSTPSTTAAGTSCSTMPSARPIRVAMLVTRMPVRLAKVNGVSRTAPSTTVAFSAAWVAASGAITNSVLLATSWKNSPGASSIQRLPSSTYPSLASIGNLVALSSVMTPAAPSKLATLRVSIIHADVRACSTAPTRSRPVSVDRSLAAVRATVELDGEPAGVKA